MVKLAHISDFHVADRARYPRAGITPKQADKYSVKLLQGRLKLLREMEVDHLVVTGDLTLSGEASEFKRAAELLKHFTEAGRLTVLPGNHDVWTADAHESRRFERVIGPQGGGVKKPNGPLYPRLVELSPEVVLLALDTARFGEDPFSTPGRLGNDQLQHAREVAREHGVNQGKAVVLALHHHLVVPPQREEQNRWAAKMPLFDADQVVRLVAELPIAAVLHGHCHAAFRVDIPGVNGPVPVLCAGSGSRSAGPDERTKRARAFVYSIDRGGVRAVEELIAD